MFVVSRKKTEQGLLLVITDKSVYGKCYTEGRRQLDLSHEFYQDGEEVEEISLNELDQAYLLHLSGEHAVALGIGAGYIDEDMTVTIAGIPHAECVIEH